MMKFSENKYHYFIIRLICLLAILCIMGCDNPDANDCFKSAGKEVEREVQLSEFSRVLIGREVEAYILQGDEYSIRIVSGENLIDDVSADIEDGRLVVEDLNTCNFVRSYGTTKVYITAPNLTEIRSSTQFEISSIGVLSYPQLSLLSENFNESGTLPLANFRFRINSERLSIVSNNSSNFFISGEVDDLSVGFFDGVGRFEGADLIAQNVQISHRGSNDMIVNPQVSIEGVIRGPGDVIAVNTPLIINVEELYTGRLLLED